MRTVCVLFIAVAACAPPVDEPTEVRPDEVEVEDVGLASGYQDFWFGTFKRGRGNVVADFDGDGDMDLFTGNPGNQSFLLRNVSERRGEIRFEPWQVLSEDEFFYGGVAADFDNDGDQDLFVSAGANDGPAADRYFRNDGDPDEPLVDASDEHPLADPNGTMGVRAFDVDNDGSLDIWASNYARTAGINRPLKKMGPVGQNQLYLNRSGGFEDRAVDLGLGVRRGSRHSSIFDFDRDGDADIYENNFVGGGILWRNRLVEDGVLSFENVTEAMSLGDRSLEGPTVNQAMCSLVADLDNDGFEDLVLLHRGRDKSEPDALQGHQVFMNVGGEGFTEIGRLTGIAAEFGEREEVSTETKIPMGTGWGVMGCQIGDIDLDGYPDIFVGTGSGATGDVNQLLVSSGRREAEVEGVGMVTVPLFESWTELIDVAPELPEGAPEVRYPFRTHGSALSDYNGDGVSELGVHNGGPAILPFEEPNRLWEFRLPDPRFLRIRLSGDGRVVSRDAIGTRVRVQVRRRSDGAEWDLYQVRHAGSGFGAQNSPELVFGLGDADRVSEVEVTWPDGRVERIDPPRGLQDWLQIRRR